MSALASTQIPKPQDEQAFERANVVLWCKLLNDPNVQRNGRRGQGQRGVDLFGIRNSDPTRLVGVQCKLKSQGHVLTEKEVRYEVSEALKFTPALSEYFIVTTSPDDAKLQQLARTITADLHAEGRVLRVYVWGWNTLEEHIAEYAEVRKAFDPSFTPHSEETLGVTRQVLAGQNGFAIGMAAIENRLAGMQAQLAQVSQGSQAAAPSDATAAGSKLEAHLDAEIDGYRALLNNGRPEAALDLLSKLLDRVQESVSGRIIFRIKANIGSCHLALGDIPLAAGLLTEAYHHAPMEPKAIANQTYALLLQGQWQEALTFAREHLQAAPENEALAGYLVQAARRDPAIEDPLALIPIALHESAPVMVAVTDFLRQRDRGPEWHKAARRAATLYPDDRQLQLMAAEATLDELGGDDDFKRSGAISAEQRGRALAAIAVLQGEWKLALAREGGIEELHAGVCSNLMVALRMVGDFDAALAVAREGRAAAPNDEDLARRAAVIAMEAGELEMARDALSVVPAGNERTVLSVGMHAQKGEWKEVAELCREIPEGLPDHERMTMVTMGRVSAIKLGDAANRKPLLEQLAAETVTELGASLIVYQAARSEQLTDLSDRLYERLKQLVDGTAHLEERFAVVHQAAKREDWTVVADLLEGHVPLDKSSDELELLARAYVNERPMRERGVRFFEQLPDQLHAQPFYIEAAALFHFNRGDLVQAEPALRAAIRTSGTTQCYLSLISTLRRQDRPDDIAKLLEGLDIAALSGSAGDRIGIAAELRSIGRGADAIRIAYDILQTAQNDPNAAMRYVGLLMEHADDQLVPVADVVAEDCWVQLESLGSQAQNFLIAAGPDRPAEGRIGLNHPMAVKCLGLKVGDAFETGSGWGQRTTWRVAAIKHKYLHTLHQVMENFETWFPNSPGLWKFTMQEGDIAPILDQVKAIGDRTQTLVDLYLAKNFPFAMIAGKTGRDVVGLVERIRSSGPLTTCIGTDPERDAAISAIADHRSSTLVMDTYAAWTAATIDLLGLLTQMFATVAVPQSTIDDLEMLRRYNRGGESESMTMSWENGKFVRYVLTPEDRARQSAYLEEQIAKIKASCKIVPVSAPDAMSDIAKFLTSSFGSHVLDPAFLASGGSLLLSEDMHFRQLANAAVPVIGVWLQAILLVAQDEKLIDRERYIKALVQLAARRHGHVVLGADDLLNVFVQDESEDLNGFSAVAQFFGTVGADMRANLAIVRQFLASIWRSDDSIRTKRGKATGILVERLISNRAVKWEGAVAYLLLFGNAALRVYLERWVIGHMLSMDDVRVAVAKLRRQGTVDAPPAKA